MPQYRTTYLTGPLSIEMGMDDRPTAGPGEVLLEMSAVGICGSDIHWYLEGGIGSTRIKAPITLGHEPAGRVIEIGDGVNPALKGKRVAIEPGISCGKCKFCLRGDTNLCPTVKFLGSFPVQGAYREFLTHPAHLVVPLPDAVNDDIGALLEPLAIAVHVADLLKPRIGCTVAIQGAGPIGLTCLLAMKLHGPEKIVVIDPVPYRRELAKTMGADHAFSPDDPDIVKEVTRATHGGAQYVIECVGSTLSFTQMVEFAEPGAKIAQVGIDPHDHFGFNHAVARRKGVTIFMVRRSRNTLDRALELTVKGYWTPEPLVSHHYGLGDLGKAMDTVANYREGVMKAIIDPRR